MPIASRKAHNNRVGRLAERWAERFLRRRGLRLVVRNWQCTTGEIDLVMLDGEVLVFVETRYRKATDWVDGLDSVDAGKRHRVQSAATRYLDINPQHAHRFAQFDVVSVTRTNYRFSCEWIRDAFDNSSC